MEKEKSAKLAALSAAIPHINFEYQKKLAVMVKMMEIKEICRYYDAANSMGAVLAQNPAWRQNLINAVLPHLNENKQKSLKNMVQVMEMQDIALNIESFKELNTEWK
jgi:polysaccharide pyruvyl transferase WcaK-like protein